MKIPKRAQRSQEIIEKMVNWLSYYMNDCDEFKRFVRTDIKELEEYLHEISLDHKTHNIRFASKLKSLWKKEMEAKDEKIQELEEKVEELSD